MIESRDNYHLLRDLMTFEKEGDFYKCYIFLRKKDRTTDAANHQSVRTIKSYEFYSVEDLDKRYEEIKQLAETFQARVYLSINAVNDNLLGIYMMKEIANRLESGAKNWRGVYDSVLTTLRPIQKRALVDIDADELHLKDRIIEIINECDPPGPKVIKEIPSKSGVHLVTKRVREDQFEEKIIELIGHKIDYQKKSALTLLYIPKSLMNK